MNDNHDPSAHRLYSGIVLRVREDACEVLHAG